MFPSEYRIRGGRKEEGRHEKQTLKEYGQDAVGVPEEKDAGKSSDTARGDVHLGLFFVIAASQSPGLPETLATAYNPGMCLWALPVIVTKGEGEKKCRRIRKIRGNR